MPRVVTGRPSSAGARQRGRRPIAAWVAVGLLVALLLGGLGIALRGPRFVDRVRVTNPTPYLVEVAVTNGAHDGWTLLGAVEPGERVDVRDVVDPGRTWVFRFTSGGAAGGELTVPRDELASRGFHVTVPPAVSARLARGNAATFAG